MLDEEPEDDGEVKEVSQRWELFDDEKGAYAGHSALIGISTQACAPHRCFEFFYPSHLTG